MTTTTTDTQPTPPETSGMGQLQSLLLQTIKDLRSGATTPQIARAITDIGQTLVASSRAEIEFARITKASRVGFLDSPALQAALPRPTADGSGHTTPLPPGQHWQGLVHRTSDEEPTR
ncbi:hypothetical protein HMPREF9701_00418 [Delftia acidovorans CCUG 274B]|uniref:hypothetical protein n=1 Tax=Delftia acidovorans TaxID=80866 RepID=UPI0003543123|nr:hypothetical protein [Delftia acidovorans]EPD44829.1 hypothetical protein HMPREF9701_00418 [Delftia acidovorans CCUG 274B]